MEYLNLYLELMTDLRFAVLSSSFFVGVIFFLGLVSMLGKKKPAPGVILGTDGGVAIPAAAVESPMTWGGAPDKTKKSSPPAPAVPQAAPSTQAEKTMVMPPPVANANFSSGGAPLSSAAVDLPMYEALVNRIAVVEADQRKEPIFLDPLIKRLSTVEKKIEELIHKVNQPPPAPPPPTVSVEGGVALPEGFNDEFLALKEKVYGLQKILEHLAEGPVPPAP